MVVKLKCFLVGLCLITLLGCRSQQLFHNVPITQLEFAEFVDNPAHFDHQNIGVKGYYVEGLPQLYKDKEFYESVNAGVGLDSTKFNYLNIIEISKYHKTKRPPSLAYNDGAYVIAYGRPTHIDLAENTIRYGGYLRVDSIVLQKSPGK